MARAFRFLGILCLAAAVWLTIAGAAGWVEARSFDSVARRAALAGFAALGAGILLGVLGRVSRPLTRGRCVRCGARTERGQTYCLDHLLATVEQAREKSRADLYQRPNAKRP